MARYKPSDPRDYLEALSFLNLAKEQDFDVELKKYYRPRSNPQNRFLHFALAYFAHRYGCTLTEAKEVYFKRYACADIFRVDTTDKKGNNVTYYRSTADLNTVEMSAAINNFVTYAQINGIDIPLPSDEVAIRYCERQIERTKPYGT